MEAETEMDENKIGPVSIRYIDLFCGIGGFHLAADSLGWKCCFACDIDPFCQKAYQANFGILPAGDIYKVAATDVPDHDVLLAGFPCQPFSIIGEQRGFEDMRGTLFFEIARTLKAKRPPAFVLENVKQLITHDHGRTFARIQKVIRELGYSFQYKILNSMKFGLPHKRERVLMVGFAEPIEFHFPIGTVPMLPLSALLEPHVGSEHFASARVQEQRRARHPEPCSSPGIWHENKQGNVSSHPYSCALRANASYNYLLVDGIRRLTPREMLRLQGFPDSFRVVCSNCQTRKQAGNAVSVPVIAAVLRQVGEALTPSLLLESAGSRDLERLVGSETQFMVRDTPFPSP